MYVRFEKVKWKNFLATGNRFIEVDLSGSATTLIVGKNGSGKSTVLDAITFALFGKPFRDINKPQLVNSINGKDCLVEIDFTIGSTKYTVRRGIKPNIFEIEKDGQLLDKESSTDENQKFLESSVLKMGYKAFTQIVILGSAAFVPFMKLSAADRRAIIEDILDITIFSSMNAVLKEKISIVQDEIEMINIKKNTLKSQIDIQQNYVNNILDLEKNRTTQLELKKGQIEDCNKKIELSKQMIDSYQVEIDDMSFHLQDKETIRKREKQLEGFAIKGQDKISRDKEEISFLKTHDNCPTCKQSIDEDFKNKRTLEKNNDINQIENGMPKLEQELSSIKSSLAEIEKVSATIDDYKRKIQLENNNVLSNVRFIESLEKDILSYSTNVDSSIEVKKLGDFMDEMSHVLSRNSALEKKLHVQQISLSMLKDGGIKTKIIKQYLPIINKMINKYLADLNFYANFTLDETFKEQIKSRNRDDFSYGSFSEGQKRRIDVALLFTWREVAKMKNSINTNLLFLDEIFDGSIDSDGIEDFMKLLNANSTNSKNNIFLISHKSDIISDNFNTVLQYELKNNFTEMNVRN